MEQKNHKVEGLVYLEDGTILKGKGFGNKGTRVGELVFHTAMVGHQKILADPSCKGQIINMTYPLIGNYGISEEDNGALRIHASGLVIKDLCQEPSNSRCIKTLDQWMKEQGIPGVFGVDTRKLTRKIRTEGTMKCVISSEGITIEEAKQLCEETQLKDDWMKAVSVKGKTVMGHGGQYKVAAMDFGLKGELLNELLKRDCQLHLFPYGTSASELLSIQPDGIFLTNGPGNPQAATEAIAETAKLIHMTEAPIFGVGMGHQILALAAGGRTVKLKFGHRGGNYGVYDKETKRSHITLQNHSYAVQMESILLRGMEVTHLNLNDGTVEGMEHRDLPVFSVQFHPGSKDTDYLFDKFINLMKGGNHNA